jgi:hypothetical protein
MQLVPLHNGRLKGTTSSVGPAYGAGAGADASTGDWHHVVGLCTLNQVDP